MFSLNSLSNEAQENDQAEQKKAEFEENDGIGVYPEEAEETLVSIFDGVAFDSSENALEANIETSNAFVTEIFSEAQQLNADVLTRSGFTNKDFLEWIKTVENVEQYSFESIYEYFNE